MNSASDIPENRLKVGSPMNSTRYSGIPSAEAPDALYPTLTANKNAVRSNRFSGFRSTSLKRWTMLTSIGD
jgi:hypothetical protein